MKIYGYKKGISDSDELLTLSEISIQTSPDILRIIAKFILETADEIDELKSKKPAHFHSHLRDNWSSWREEYSDIVIVQE